MMKYKVISPFVIKKNGKRTSYQVGDVCELSKETAAEMKNFIEKIKAKKEEEEAGN